MVYAKTRKMKVMGRTYLNSREKTVSYVEQEKMTHKHAVSCCPCLIVGSML